MNHCGILVLAFLTSVTAITFGRILIPMLFRILVRKMSVIARSTVYREIAI